MAEAATPALLLFPRFGHDSAVREVAPGETFMRMTQASTNYVALGEAGFTAMTRFVKTVPARAIDYQSGAEAISLAKAVGAAGMSRDAMLLVRCSARSGDHTRAGCQWLDRFDRNGTRRAVDRNAGGST